MASNDQRNVPSKPAANRPVGSAVGSQASAAPPIYLNGVPAKGLKGLRAALIAMAQGWAGLLRPDESIPTFAGGINCAATVAELNAWLALYANVVATKAAWLQATSALGAAEPKMRQRLALLKSAVMFYFGVADVRVAQFGIKPKRPRAKLSVDKLVVRAERSRRTRVIRGTLGPKQRAALGTYTGPLVAQVVPAESAASAPAAAGRSPASEPSSALTPGTPTGSAA